MTTKAKSLPASIAAASWLHDPATQRVFAALNQNGYVARAVGGCVRNALLAAAAPLGHAPAPPQATDIDIATTATPEQTLTLAAAAGLKTVPTGLQHGTITVIANGRTFEVTTLRRDVTTDGRRAEVAFTDDWAMDAARRDFTMNALYADASGTVFDPLGGYTDLRAGIIRFVGDPTTRIREDYLRILRFFRFSAEYGRDAPDPASLNACVLNRRGIEQLSAERIRQELVKLVVAKGAARTIADMAGYGILSEILPIAPNISRLAALIERDTPPDAALRIATLTIHVAENVATVTDRLRLSKAETAALTTIAKALSHRVELLAGQGADLTTARKLLYMHGPAAYQRIIKFHWTLSGADQADLAWLALLDLPNRWQPPTLPVTGQNLLSLGVAAGPELGCLLSALETLWIDADFSENKARLLAEAKRHIEKTEKQ